MTDSLLSKAATMEIPINSNGDSRSAEDDSLEQGAQIGGSLDEIVGTLPVAMDLQQVMVSGPNLNETSIVSGGYGGAAEGIIPTSSIKDIRSKSRGITPSQSAASRIANQPGNYPAPGMHHSNSNPSLMSEEATKGVAVEKFDTVKKWSINTYKCTKQMFSERFGRGTKTVDLELEAQIDVLRETKLKYERILRLARELTNHFYNMVQTQQALGDTFADLSQKSPELQDEFGYNAETQRLLCKNGETLLGAINFFVSSINTLVNKTMEDTLMTIKTYENARLEFDAYRSDLEELSAGPRDAATMMRIEIAQQQYQIQKDKYERLHSDVTIKLKFLEENKVKVMHKQLLLFHNAISAYFAGNQQQLEQTLRQFNVKLKPPGSDKPSWLEEQ
ncbi:arfaptin-2a isoform X2 [Danio rerio]|uniref:Arfaptin-2a isoform X2 n=1 Tax=Danio rerio TaxID=7955 RepID=A0A8M2B452_DANRE|nr:ADP-ribosylation factor interacting protein 2a isoform X2 [Danio rerio]|eukprot:XP_005157416.1 ADP-ribosylation factor interacting protein 2a isoform X2 [Danio rerio]